MSIQYLGDDGPDGTVVFQSGQKGAFFGVTTVTAKQAIVTTVDSTTITTVKTAAITTAAVTTNTVFQGLADTKLRNQALAINRLIVDAQLNAETVNKLVADAQLSGETVNKLVADDRLVALAVNTVISRLQELGLIA